MPREREICCSLVEPDPSIPLPSCWSHKDKHQFLDLFEGNFKVTYVGEGKSNNDAATVRADFPVPPSCGIFYFEISILSKGKEGFIGVGACASSVSLSRLPGWDRYSYGYHGDDGKAFRESGTGSPFGPGFVTGDVVGCGINYVRNEIFYTKNGVLLGAPFKNITRRSLYPCIGLRSQGEEIMSNFGQKPFRFDVEAFFEDERQWIHSEMMKTEIPGKTDPAPELVLSYLVHCGFSDTADAFMNALFDDKDSHSVSLEEMKERRTIYQLVVDAKIAEAEEMCRKKYDGMIESDVSGILFDLNCQHFIEIVRSGDTSSAVLFGKTKLAGYTKSTDSNIQSVLCNVFSLLAYQNPAESPVAFLLQKSNRVEVADRLNAAILRWKGHPTVPPLELVVKQSSVCLNVLRSVDVGSSVCFDLCDFVEGSN